MLEKDQSVSIHHRNVQSFVLELHTLKNELAPMITINISCAMPENHYNLRNHDDFRYRLLDLFTTALRASHIYYQKYEILFPLN